MSTDEGLRVALRQCPDCHCLIGAHYGPRIGCEGAGGNCGCSLTAQEALDKAISLAHPPSADNARLELMIASLGKRLSDALSPLKPHYSDPSSIEARTALLTWNTIVCNIGNHLAGRWPIFNNEEYRRACGIDPRPDRSPATCGARYQDHIDFWFTCHLPVGHPGEHGEPSPEVSADAREAAFEIARDELRKAMGRVHESM